MESAANPILFWIRKFVRLEKSKCIVNAHLCAEICVGLGRLHCVCFVVNQIILCFSESKRPMLTNSIQYEWTVYINI